MAISYQWPSKSFVWHNDNISVSLQWRHMNVTVSQITSNSTFIPQCEFLRSVSWPIQGTVLFRLGCMLEWSLSDRSMFPLTFPREHQRMGEETSNARSFQRHQYLYKPHWSFTSTWMSLNFMCPSNYVLDTNENILMLTLGPQCREKLPHRNKPNIR